MQKRCLVISYGPVPTPEYQTVEGGGMRAWGLAKGLLANGVETTVAINAGFPLTLESHDGISLINWSLDNQFAQTLNSYDAVIVSYCAGDLSVFVADHISDDVQLILDAYVPIYIEVSARDAKDMDEEYVNYAADLQRHNHTLKRGDYFLYANPAQEQLYSGVLSALGIINPLSYRDKRLLSTPFGIHRDAIVTTENPYKKLSINEDDFVVLWFGGIYPWFRIEEYLEAIKELSGNKKIKFVFVGGKNPFNANPDIARQYDKTVAFSNENKLTDTSVFFVDWVDFDTRIDWFRNASVIVSLNQPGEENKYSWRTRVMDFVWGEAATITNGGDPLSEEMIDNNAALRIKDLSANAIIDALTSLSEDSDKLDTIEQNVRSLKDKYYWDVVTQDLAETVKVGTLHFSNESRYRKLLSESNSNQFIQESSSNGKLRKVAALPIKVLRKIRKKGIKKTIKVAADITRNQIKSISVKREKQFVFISHPIDNTGAPVVLLQIVEEYVQKYGPSRVRVIAPGATKNQENFLKSLGIRPEKAVHAAGFRFIRLQLNLRPDDFVLMNTVAIYDNYRDFILLWLRLGRLKHAYWFVHEDKAQIPIINPNFDSPQNISNINNLIKAKKVTLLFPSKRTAEEYNEEFKFKGSGINLRVDVPTEYTNQRSAEDFNSIQILLSGTSQDGRKGQILALSALQDYVDNYYSKNPDQYRKVHMNLLAVGKDDYISQQVRWVASSALSDFVSVYEAMPKNDALELARRCNAVLCCSLNETFGLYIAEGMLMGHVVIRNDVAGVDEQLMGGKNGFLIDHTNIKDISRVIERIANKKITTNGQLLSMGKKSQQIMGEHTNSSYLSQIESI